LSIDNHCRQRGNDERDAPLLLELEGDAAEHLEHTQAIQAQPAAGWC
jgi:hypothetical protein